MNFKELPPFLSIAQTSNHFPIGRTSIYARIKKGVFVATKLGSRTIISTESIVAYFESLPAFVGQTEKKPEVAE